MTDTNTLAPTDDLQKRCAEIIGWCRTGVLVGDTLRSHAESKWPGDIHSLQMAERATENEALCFIAKWGAHAPASQPFAYEFSRSNGDGTHSEHIERGRLQEVAPGRWEHSGLPRGALADKPIKALYTTPQTQPAAVPAAGPVGFDHKTAANFLNGKTVTDEEVRQFIAHSRGAHDDRDWLRNTIADLRREIAQRNAEIALLKTSLLDAESPTQAAQAQDPRFCYRSHPHEHQDTHCQLREVSAWLRWHASACTTPSADSMRLYADQVDAVAHVLPAAQPKSVDENDSECEAPPIGWRCTRTRGHAGPCAAVVSPEDRAFVERGMRRIRDAVDAERYRCLRSIRHWIIVDGRGYELRDDGLDSAIDDAIAAKKGDAA